MGISKSLLLVYLESSLGYVQEAATEFKTLGWKNAQTRCEKIIGDIIRDESGRG